MILFAATITAGVSLVAEGDLERGALFALVGALYTLLTAHEDSLQRMGPRRHAAVMVGDVLLVSGIVWLTGGINSEYHLLYFVPVAAAAARLQTRAGLVYCAAVAGIYPVVAIASPPQSAVLTPVVAKVISVLVGSLVVAIFLVVVGREAQLSEDLRDTLHHSLRRVAAVYEVAHAANTGVDLTGVLSIILDHAAKATGAASGSVFLTSEDGQLRPMASLYTPSGAAGPSSQLPIEPALEALRGSAPVTTSVSQTGDGQQANAVYVPLHTPAGPLGVLAIVSRRNTKLTPRQLDCLNSLCSEAALAIENASLRSELRRLAVTDPLTGLPNRREIERHLALELDRATRRSRPLSVMMVDVDDLKEVNDEYGHAAGDEVLVALARMLQRSIRSTDIGGRIGGDEFMVLLPETEQWQALALAERLVNGLPGALRGCCGLSDPDHVARTVGLSIGIAGTEDGPTSPDKLAARADAALYAAKRTGKNRARLASEQMALG
ncbi:MAG: diguanylate cyclase [Armatimonadota bacterium]